MQAALKTRIPRLYICSWRDYTLKAVRMEVIAYLKDTSKNPMVLKEVPSAAMPDPARKAYVLLISIKRTEGGTQRLVEISKPQLSL